MHFSLYHLFREPGPKRPRDLVKKQQHQLHFQQQQSYYPPTSSSFDLHRMQSTTSPDSFLEGHAATYDGAESLRNTQPMDEQLIGERQDLIGVPFTSHQARTHHERITDEEKRYTNRERPLLMKTPETIPFQSESGESRFRWAKKIFQPQRSREGKPSGQAIQNQNFPQSIDAVLIDSFRMGESWREIRNDDAIHQLPRHREKFGPVRRKAAPRVSQVLSRSPSRCSVEQKSPLDVNENQDVSKNVHETSTLRRQDALQHMPLVRITEHTAVFQQAGQHEPGQSQSKTSEGRNTIEREQQRQSLPSSNPNERRPQRPVDGQFQDAQPFCLIPPQLPPKSPSPCPFQLLHSMREHSEQHPYSIGLPVRAHRDQSHSHVALCSTVKHCQNEQLHFGQQSAITARAGHALQTRDDCDHSEHSAYGNVEPAPRSYTRAGPVSSSPNNQVHQPVTSGRVADLTTGVCMALGLFWLIGAIISRADHLCS